MKFTLKIIIGFMLFFTPIIANTSSALAVNETTKSRMDLDKGIKLIKRAIIYGSVFFIASVVGPIKVEAVRPILGDYDWLNNLMELKGISTPWRPVLPSDIRLLSETHRQKLYESLTHEQKSHLSEEYINAFIEDYLRLLSETDKHKILESLTFEQKFRLSEEYINTKIYPMVGKILREIDRAPEVLHCLTPSLIRKMENEDKKKLFESLKAEHKIRLSKEQIDAFTIITRR